jgi:Domain of unknown function (DUF5600)/Cytoskeletal-regulatory complex EF hand
VQELPRYAAVRKINELVKRARMARVHSLIIGHLKGQMPFFGQASAQKKMLEHMAEEFYTVMKKHRLPQGDFPNIARFTEVAGTFDFSKFKKTDEKMLAAADDALGTGIPALLAQLGHELDDRAAKEKELHSSFLEGTHASAVLSKTDGAAARMGGGLGGASPSPTDGGSTGAAASASNPFGGGGGDAYAQWCMLINKVEADSVMKMQPGGLEGRLSGSDARSVLLDSGLEVDVLRKIWDLSDVDKDGWLSGDEFAICWYLLQMSKAGKPIPDVLPAALVPPGKKTAA